MTITQFLAVIPARDLDASVAWYERLLGLPPTGRPMDGLVEWELPGGSGLQVFADTDRAGSGQVTVVVEDIAGVIGSARDRGLDVAEPTPVTVGVVVTITDPDGNRVTLVDPATTA